jgi:hypothetical protein
MYRLLIRNKLKTNVHLVGSTVLILYFLPLKLEVGKVLAYLQKTFTTKPFLTHLKRLGET